jgi:8-oxo-dGTP pyrophosphatase MutT (NUDIX family)
MMLLLMKSHNKGYTRKDGTVVLPFSDKRVAKVKAKGKLGKYEVKPKAPGKAKAPEKATEKAAPLQGGLFGGWFGISAPSKKAGPSSAPAPASYPNAIEHPKVGDDGKPFNVYNPSSPSAEAAWKDPDLIAQFVPGGKAPAVLNGVAFAPWTDHPKTVEGWDYVDGQMDDLDEPALVLKNGKAPAAGVLIEEPDGRVWIVKPSNGFAGYRATFPKGHADDGLSLQATAIKECFEESGLQVEITGFALDVERGQTITRYYRARRVGGSPTDCGWETQAVALVPKDQLIEQLNRSVDHPIAHAVGAPGGMDAIDDWEQVGKQAGSNPGGVYRDAAGARWYCKFPKTSNIAKNEVLAAKLYDAAGVRVPEVKLVTDDGHVGVASRMIDGVRSDKDAVTSGAPGVYEGFAADAWLANWDAVGLLYDNLLMAPDGEAVRIDTGGSLIFRAQGEPKGSAFGDYVGEVDTLRSPKNPQAFAVFGSVPGAAVSDGVGRIADVPDDTIRDLCHTYGPGTVGQRASLAARLIARKEDLVDRFWKDLHEHA